MLPFLSHERHTESAWLGVQARLDTIREASMCPNSCHHDKRNTIATQVVYLHRARAEMEGEQHLRVAVLAKYELTKGKLQTHSTTSVVFFGDSL